MTILPNFFIVGAAKAGTTSLYWYLREHPDVFMCPYKEPNFFSYEDIKKQNLYYKENGVGKLSAYKKLFTHAHEKKIGEASVSYLFYENAPRRIKKLVPDAKIIILLRNPIQRAYSHYLMDKRLGYVSIPFEDIIYKQTIHPFLNLYYQQYIELGLYFEQVQRYIETFGTDNVKIYKTSNLKNNLSHVMQDLCVFLEIDPLFSFSLGKSYNVFEEPKNQLFALLYASAPLRSIVRPFTEKIPTQFIKRLLFSSANKPELGRDSCNYLMSIFKDDIMKTEELIKQNLSYWYEDKPENE